MKQYDYRHHMVNDIIDYIKYNDIDIFDEDIEDRLCDDLWYDKEITGNCESFYASEEKCQEYVATNLPLYFEAVTEFSDFPRSRDTWIYNNPAQHMDATIRCYLLGECISTAVNELRQKVDESFFEED